MLLSNQILWWWADIHGFVWFAVFLGVKGQMRWPLSSPHTLLLLVPTINVTNLLTSQHGSYSRCLTRTVGLQQRFILSNDWSATSIDAWLQYRWIVLILLMAACHRISLPVLLGWSKPFISDGNEAENLLSHETTIQFSRASSLVKANTTDTPFILNRWSPPPHPLSQLSRNLLFIITFMFFCRALLEASTSLLFCISKACIQRQPSDLIYGHQSLMIQLGLRWQSELLQKMMH